MNKDFISNSDIWINHNNVWKGYQATEISNNLANAYKVAQQAENAISYSGLDGIDRINLNIAESKIIDLETNRERLERFCERIHSDAEDLIDDIFNYGVMKTLTELYDLNPSDVKGSSTTANVNLKSMMQTIIIDLALKINFSIKSKYLDEDILTDELKTDVVNAVGRYYEGDSSKYLKNKPGCDTITFKEDMDLVIEYYEYLNPMDGKNMDKLFKSMDKFGSYDQDIRNIKFLVYTAKEPYKTVFFKYLPDLHIENYDVNGTQYYDSGDKHLYLDFNNKDDGVNDPRGAYVTFFHEIGHAIDDLSAKDKTFLFWTMEYKFTTLENIQKPAENDVRTNIRESVEKYVEKMGYTLSEKEQEAIVKAMMTYNFPGFATQSVMNKVYQGVISQYKTVFTQTSTNATIYCGISDVYGGYTDNKLRGTYGHDNEKKVYWNDTSTTNNDYNGKQARELWAEAFSRYMTSNDEAIEQMKKYFPSAVADMEEIYNSWEGEINKK